MIAIGVCQALNNSIAVHMCRHILANRSGNIYLQLQINLNN